MHFTILHSPNFADYRGDHAQIIIPRRSIAAIDIPAEIEAAGKLESLNHAYRYTQHAVANGGEPWWLNDGLMLHVRSTSPGDIIVDETGRFWVVEQSSFSLIDAGALTAKCQGCGRPLSEPQEASSMKEKANG